MGPDFPGSFERGIISSGYWGETISPGFDGQDLPWSLWGGGFPDILVVRDLPLSLKSPVIGEGKISRVIDGVSPGHWRPRSPGLLTGVSLRLWLEKSAQRLRYGYLRPADVQPF